MMETDRKLILNMHLHPKVRMLMTKLREMLLPQEMPSACFKDEIPKLDTVKSHGLR